MKCPVCSCQHFYVKDPDDPYETYSFECRGDDLVLDDEAPETIAVDDQTEAFCDRCVWHGKVDALK